MEIPYEEIEVKDEEICDANLPTTSANVNESPFEFTAPTWNERNYEFSATPVDSSYEKVKAIY